MASYDRYGLIQSFDEIRSSFLAALDQIVAEMRPRLQAVPKLYSDSVRACADAFAEPALVKAQLLAVDPDIFEHVSEDDFENAHLATISYLFSLTLHEMIRNNTNTSKELPDDLVQP